MNRVTVGKPRLYSYFLLNKHIKKHSKIKSVICTKEAKVTMVRLRAEPTASHISDIDRHIPSTTFTTLLVPQTRPSYNYLEKAGLDIWFQFKQQNSPNRPFGIGGNIDSSKILITALILYSEKH